MALTLRNLHHALVGAALLVSPALVDAHNLDAEAQVYLDDPQNWDTGDSSFWIAHELKWFVEDSQAIFAYLGTDDIDVFSFSITPEDLQDGPVTVTAFALAPACEETQRAYPATALIGPSLPGPELPFGLSLGFGYVVARNPEVEGRRPVFELHELGLGWFLPAGLSRSCLAQAPSSCDFSNTINQQISTPGYYRIAVWDPQGEAQDYVLSVGLREDNTVRIPFLESFVRDQAWMHTQCTPVHF